MTTYAIGVDIGGTKIAIGLVDRTGRVRAEKTLPTNLSIPPSKMVQQIISALKQLVKESGKVDKQIAGIGIGAPGPLDAKNGTITCPPNLHSWINVPIVEMFTRDFSIPIFLENDANAAALAEKWVGAARESENFLYMTISTGIGAGIFLDGKLIAGFRGNAGDVGHIVIDPAYGTCPCGQQGCFEWIASGTAIARQASHLLGRQISAKEAFQLYSQNHLATKSLIDQIFNKIGVGCVTLINLFDPEMIVIGGGVTQVGEPLFAAVQKYVSQYALNPSGRKTKILPSLLDQNTGLVGAAALVFYNRGDKHEAISG
jgi:glucokinase